MVHRKLVVLILSMYLVQIYCDEPIIKVDPGCPDVMAGTPTLVLYADVPAHATAKCKNGDQVFSANDRNVVKQQLDGSFVQSYSGSNCQFNKKVDANTFTVEVEVGWGEDDSHVVGIRKVFTMSCAYDDHGQAISPDQSIGAGFIAPRERQGLQGSDSSAAFQLKVIDILDQEIENSVVISMGRKVRLRAEDTSDTIAAFKAISCVARNDETYFPILRAGCGDGLVFPKTGGFITEGKVVYSPYFEFFKLKGSTIVRFECSFTVCASNCDGDSCAGVVDTKRKRRSYSMFDTQYKGVPVKAETVALPVIIVASQTHTLAVNGSETLDPKTVRLVMTKNTENERKPNIPVTRGSATDWTSISGGLIAAALVTAVLLMGAVLTILFLYLRTNHMKPETV